MIKGINGKCSEQRLRVSTTRVTVSSAGKSTSWTTVNELLYIALRVKSDSFSVGETTGVESYPGKLFAQFSC